MKNLTHRGDQSQAGSRSLRRSPTGAMIPPARLSAFVDLHRRLGNSAVKGLLQAKLSVSPPDDAYEQEADRVADQVVRMPESAITVAGSSSPAIDRRPCEEDELRTGPVAREALVQRHAPEHKERLLPAEPTTADGVLVRRVIPEDEEQLQRRRSNHEDSDGVSAEVEHAIHGLAGRGTPLGESIRDFMEPRFGVDFGAVRVHTDCEAGNLARSFKAQAFTVGREVVFGARRYASETDEGRRLSAHELTHVVQQRDGVQRLQREVACPRRPAGETARSRSGFLDPDDRAVFTASANRLECATSPSTIRRCPPV